MRIAVLASGSGTILQSFLDAGVPVTLVLVDRSCGATAIAAANAVPVALVERTSFGPSFDRDLYSSDVVAVLNDHGIELVVMAGFGTIFGESMFDAFGGRILNTHPALLPSFKGWHAVRDALSYGVKVTGCTVHVATSEVDAGPILAQEAISVAPGDTETSLHERIKVVERELYVRTVENILQRGSIL